MPQLEKYSADASRKLELIISYLGVTATVASTETVGKKLKLKVNSEDAGRIIGRRGRTLASIQLLLNSAMHQSDDPLPEIIIEIEGYERHKREEGGPRRRSGNKKRERGDRDDRGDRNEKRRDNRRNKRDDNDDDSSDNNSRRRNSQKRRNNQNDKNERAKDAFSAEDAEYFVNFDDADNGNESNTDTPAKDAPQAEVAETTSTPEAVTAEAAPVETAPEAEAAPAAESDATPEAPAPQEKKERLPDNIFQCRQKAIDAAKEVKRWGEEITLRGMTSDERQAVRDALSDDSSIEVVEGEVTGPDKRKVTLREKSSEKALNN